jgi:predicted  nucleic acid-binding Zn-ribbon protein
VRAKVAKIREENKATFDHEDIKATIENIRQKMQNLYKMAENATDDETIADLTQRMNNYEKLKRDAESMLYDLEEDEEERAELEKELVKFEKWAEDVRPSLTDPAYIATASYDELRLAVRILGLRVTVFPTVGDWPFRCHIDVTVPDVMRKLHCVANDPYMS